MNMYTKPGKQREVLREKGLPKKEVGVKKKKVKLADVNPCCVVT